MLKIGSVNFVMLLLSQEEHFTNIVKNVNVYFEIKGFRRDRDLYKMYLVLKEYPDINIKMIEKEELDNLERIDIFNLPNFNEKYNFEDIDTTKFINIWN